MSPREYKAKHTHTEHLTWLAWLDEEMNHPSRTDHYLIHLTMELTRFMHLYASGKVKELKVQDFVLKFVDPSKPKTPLTPEQIRLRAAQSRAAWLGMVPRNKDGKRLLKTGHTRPPGKNPFFE